MKKIVKRLLSVVCLPLVCAFGQISQAAVWTNAPTAGTLLNELEPERRVEPGLKEPEVEIRAPELQKGAGDRKIRVDRISFDWTELHLLDDRFVQAHDTVLHGLVDPSLGGELTFSQLVGLSEKTTLELRRRGYPTALVYIPRQNMKDHELEMKVILGTYDRIEVTNTSALSSQRLKGILYRIRQGKIISNKELNDALLLLNDLPGIVVKADMAPAERAGTAGLTLTAKNTRRFEGALHTDNQGNRSTGRYRAGLNLNANNLFHSGDQLSVGFMTSTKRDLDNWNVSYSQHIGRKGVQWVTSASRMTYELGSGFSYMNASGASDTVESRIKTPLRRGVWKSDYFDLAWRFRRVRDDMFGGAFSTLKASNALEASLHGFARSAKTSFSYDLAHTWGHVRMKNDLSVNGDIYATAGDYHKTDLNLYFVRSLSPAWSLHLSASGQYSWSDNLDSSEDFYIGGSSAVRAYPGGEASGDWGGLFTAEFRLITPAEGLTLTGFYDLGYVRYYRRPLGTEAGARSRTLAGAGFGLIYNKSRQWYAKFDCAFPLTDSYSRSYGKDNRCMMWFRLVRQL